MWTQPEVDASTANDATAELQTLIDEMRLQDFDSIRFATYRAACKLRFIQKKTSVHLVDIWNMIESFRENGLNALPITTQVKMSRLELLLTTIFHNLNKRLPTTQHIDTDKSISLLLSFLVGAYDRQQTGRLTVFSIKIALATICAGKLVDKLRYVFSQISDSTGIMEWDKFKDYLQQVLALATAVFEGPTFGYSETALQQCFQKDQKVSLNTFLDVLMSDPCPPCLMWLPLLHRMASVEHVYHPVICDACQARSFTGFRYKCQRCANYQLCQNCFWRGRTSGTHSNEHEMKEYSSYKSPSKQLAHSIHKSLRCMPMANRTTHPVFPEVPQRPLDLSNVVPMTPTTARHHAPDPIIDWSSQVLPGQFPMNGAMMDDEHKLIARYSAKLSGRAQYPSSLMLKERSAPMDESLDERAMIARLEEENGEMLREMELLEQQQELENTDDQLNGLRERKAQLEEKMHVMQQTRRQLMQQLEALMSQLNTKGIVNGGSMGAIPESLSGIGSRVTNAFRDHSMPRAGSLPAAQLQGDLLHAADDITTNMGTLLKELDQAQEEMVNGGGAESS
uniref:Dystrobrevin n=2 Tax=Parascaris univalens TaxID=6257 RepID=A0A915C5R3_PARUN